MMRLVLIAAMALALFAGEAEAATQQGTAALVRWKTMDICTRQAQAAYPDFTAESNAKRDAQLNACLNANNLPPRQPESQPNPR
jgi:hypothetical protein